MGLLDAMDDPTFRLGMGLLGAGSARSDGAGLGQRLNEVVGGMDQWAQQKAAQKRQALQEQMFSMQMQEMQQKLATEKQMRELAAKFQLPGQPALAPLQGDAETGILPSAGKPAVAPSYDFKGFANAVAGIDPVKAISIQSALQKETPFNKVDTDKFTPESLAKFQQTQNYGDLKPRDKLENWDGIGVNPFDQRNAGRAVPNPNKPFSLDGNGGVVANTAFQAYELAKANASAARTQNNLINAGPKAFDMELGKLDAEQLNKWRGGAETAQSTIGIVNNLRNAEAKGAYSGGTANARMAIANFVNGITGATPKGFVGSQLYNAEASKLVLDRIKALGANPSNADREFIEKTVPQLSTSSEARQQMADFMERQANQAIDLYQRADTHARKNSGLAGFNPITAPATDLDSLVKKYAR